MSYWCPVCNFAGLPDPPANYEICPCCGTEFGNDDAQFSHRALRDLWLIRGAHWFFGNPPPNWSAYRQLLDAGSGFESIGGVIAEESLGSLSINATPAQHAEAEVFAA